MTNFKKQSCDTKFVFVCKELNGVKFCVVKVACDHSIKHHYEDHRTIKIIQYEVVKTGLD